MADRFIPKSESERFKGFKPVYDENGNVNWVNVDNPKYLKGQILEGWAGSRPDPGWGRMHPQLGQIAQQMHTVGQPTGPIFPASAFGERTNLFKEQINGKWYYVNRQTGQKWPLEEYKPVKDKEGVVTGYMKLEKPREWWNDPKPSPSASTPPSAPTPTTTTQPYPSGNYEQIVANGKVVGYKDVQTGRVNYVWKRVKDEQGRIAYQNFRTGARLNEEQWKILVKTKDPISARADLTSQELEEFIKLPPDYLAKITSSDPSSTYYPPDTTNLEPFSTQAQKKPATPQSRFAPQNKAASRLAGQKAFTEAVSESAKAMQSGAPSATDANVVPNTPSGRPDYKYYADMLNAADSNDSYYRDFLNLRNQARAAAREAAASNMRYQFVPIRDDRANRIYFVNADGSDVVLDMGKPEDVREYRRVAEKIGVDINHLSDWMDRSSKPLARYNMPPGSNVDTTPDFGFWRKLPSTKAEGAEPAMDTPSTPTNLGLSLGERNLPRSAKMPSPQSTLETMQRMRDLRMPLGGFPAAQTPEPAPSTPAAPAAAPRPAVPRPAGESTRMMEMRRGPRMGEMEPSMSSETLERTEQKKPEMQQPAVAAVAPQPQMPMPRAAAMMPAGQSGVRRLESELPAEQPLPPVEQGQVGAPVVLTPSNMPRVNPEDEDMIRFRQYRNFIPR